ncbi:hypothetical protein V6N13_097443 [Hibiscus sabdariffa]
MQPLRARSLGVGFLFLMWVDFCGVEWGGSTAASFEVGWGWVAQQQYPLRLDQVRCTDIRWSTHTPQYSCHAGSASIGSDHCLGEQHRANEIVHQHDQSPRVVGRVGVTNSPHPTGHGQGSDLPSDA